MAIIFVLLKVIAFQSRFLFFESYLISLTFGDEGAFFTNIFRKKEVKYHNTHGLHRLGQHIYMTNRNTTQSLYMLCCEKTESIHM